MITESFQVLKLILKQGFTIVQQPANERAFPVIYTPSSGETKQLPIKVLLWLHPRNTPLFSDPLTRFLIDGRHLGSHALRCGTMRLH